MKTNYKQVIFSCLFAFLCIQLYGQKKASPQQKFLLAWHNTKNFFDTELYYDDKERKKKALEILKEWERLTNADIKALDNQVLEIIISGARNYLKGDLSRASKQFNDLKTFRNSNNVLTKSNWRQVENMLGQNVYYLDSIYVRVTPQKIEQQEKSVLKYIPVFRNITPLPYATLKTRLKAFAASTSDNRKDRMMIELLMAQVKFVSDTLIQDTESYKSKLDSLKQQESLLFEDPILLGWAEKNRSLISMISRYLMTYIDGGKDDCKALKQLYDRAYEMNKSYHPLERVRLRHYQYFYGIDFSYVYNMIESCGCKDVKDYAWSNFEARLEEVQRIAQEQYKAVSQHELKNLNIDIRDVVVKNELEKLKSNELEFLASWQLKLELVRNQKVNRIQDYISLIREKKKSSVYAGRDQFIRQTNNFQADRHLAVLLDQYFELYLEYPSVFRGKKSHDKLEEVFDETIRLYKSTSPRDRMLLSHLAEYYGIDFDFVLDVIRKSPFQDLNERLRLEEQGYRNAFAQSAAMLKSDYQLAPINLTNVDPTKVNAVEKNLIPVLNQKLALYQADLTKTNLYEFSQQLKRVVDDGNRFLLRYTDNNALQEEIQSLYDLDRFYYYLLTAKYTDTDSKYKDENALFRLKRAYESIKRDYESGHPLRKTRSIHYAKHYGISLDKLNQIIEVNIASVPSQGSIQKVADVDRNPTPYHPGKGSFDIGNYDAEHILEAFRQKWALEGELINKEFEYVFEFVKLRERLKSEHVTITKYKDAKVVSDENPKAGYYKDLFYLTEAFEGYLLKDDELDASSEVCENLKKAVVKSGDSCGEYEFLSNSDFNQSLSSGTGPTSIRAKEACFGIDEIRLKEIMEAALCCPKGSIPVVPNVLFSNTSHRATEGIDNQVTVSVSLSNDFPKKIEIPLMLKGTAIANVDYRLALPNQSLTIPAKSKTASFTIEILNDSLKDWDKELKIELGDPVNAVVKGNQSYSLMILDDDNTLEKQAKARVKKLLFKGFDGDYIEISKVKDEDIPGELKLKGKDGGWFIVKLKHLQKALLFDGGSYSIEDKRMHGGETGDENYELYRKSMFEFRKIIIGILDTYGEEQKKELYHIFLVGGADKVVFRPKDLSAEYNSKMFTSIPVVPYDHQRSEHIWGKDVKLKVGENSYALGTGKYKCSHANFKYCNADLPHLRAAFIRYMFTDFFEIKQNVVSILEGFVSDRVRNEDRNCLILMNVDESLIQGLTN